MKVPEEFEDALKHGDEEDRIRLLKDMIKQAKDRTACVPVLIKCLEDKSWRVRKTAVEILVDIKGEEVIKELIKTLSREDNVNARNSAIEALTALGSEATRRLCEAFKHEDASARKFIVDILGVTKDFKAFPLLLDALDDKDENVRTAAIEYLGAMPKNVSAVDALIKALKSGDNWVAYHAAEALGKMGDKLAVEALIHALSDKVLMKAAIKALGQIAEPGSLSFIIPFLKDKAVAVREDALLALEQFFRKGTAEEVIIEKIKDILGQEVVDILTPYTHSLKKDVRNSAVLLLGFLRVAGLVDSLLEMAVREEYQETARKALSYAVRAQPESLLPFFDEPDIYRRRVVCEIAGDIKSDIFFKPLVRCLKDRDGHVRENAALALSELNNPGAIQYIRPLLLDEYENIQEKAVYSLSRFKKWLNVNEIIDGLSDGNSSMRKNSALLLGLIGGEGEVEALGGVLKDSAVSVRIAAAEALDIIGSPGTVRLLIQALTDESPMVRRIAAGAIGKIRAEEGAGSLLVLLRDPDVWVRSAAARGLGYIGSKKAIAPLIKALSEDESGFVKTAVIEALGNFREEKVKNILLKLLGDRDAEMRSAAIESLANFDKVAQSIIPLLQDREWSVRKKAVDVLGKFFRKESSVHLMEVANTDEDSQVRETAQRYTGD